ncbi:MAG: PAS domain S-box protein [Candidatus Hatepunaea meridiana]|nr:PAS domain S-box protein [Candidatus Hatepunaea meridiana]
MMDKEAFLKNILESSSFISIISTDLNGMILYWNSGAENIFGYKAEEVVKREKIDILYYSAEDSKITSEKIKSDIIEHKKGTSCIIKELTKNGRKLWINMTLTPRLDKNGDLIGILGIGEDITERKQAEEELQFSLKQLRKSLEGIVYAMVKMVETRDPYTAGHQRRVADLSVAIAREMNLPADQIEGIDMAGIVHDIGKISVPSEILSSPARLTNIQFEMIKTHAQVGYDIMEDIEFPWSVARIALQHHERLDGSGYPNGLKGDEILLEAKILAVADVVEAMASHRPYRPALGMDKALEEISSKRGTFFEPEIVDACLRIIKEKGFKFD